MTTQEKREYCERWLQTNLDHLSDEEIVKTYDDIQWSESFLRW